MSGKRMHLQIKRCSQCGNLKGNGQCYANPLISFEVKDISTVHKGCQLKRKK